MAAPTEDEMLTFEVYRGAALLRKAELDSESVTIGSGKSAVLSIPDGSLAELHAVVNVGEDGSLHVLDLGSDGGTRVNGEPVSNQPVQDGDAIEMGDVRVVIRRGPQAEASPIVPPEEESTLVSPADATTATPAPGRATPPPKAMAAPLADEPEEAPEKTEDVMSFILRSGTATSALGVDKRRPKVLEVSQIYGETLLDTRHFPKEGKPVTIGSSIGWRWNFLGVDMGWVGAPLHLLLRYTPPFWSQVDSDWRNDFYSPDDKLEAAEHQLFTWDGQSWVAHVHESWDGFVDVSDASGGSERRSFADLLASGKAEREGQHLLIRVDEDARLMVRIGEVVYFAHLVHPGQKILARMSEDVDYPFVAIFSLVAFVGLMFGLFMYFLPPPPQNEMVEIPDRFTRLILETPPEQETKTKPSGEPDAGEGAKAKREEGEVGKKDAELEKAKGNKVEIQKQQQDREIAENAGVLGANVGGAELEGVFGSSGLSADLTGGIGGITGVKGTQIGSGGLGSRGSGLGGGGSAEGLGGTGTQGMGGGSSGFGASGGNFGAKGDGAIGTFGGDPIILGALDRSLIDEVIKRHMNQIRYCYQRELPRNPSLAGKITVKFVIAKDGSVSSASVKETTMHNPAVEECVVGRFMRMQFPQPKGGGIVIVSYPFHFSQS